MHTCTHAHTHPQTHTGGYCAFVNWGRWGRARDRRNGLIYLSASPMNNTNKLSATFLALVCEWVTCLTIEAWLWPVCQGPLAWCDWLLVGQHIQGVTHQRKNPSKDQKWQISEKIHPRSGVTNQREIHPKIRSDKPEKKSIQRSGVTNQWKFSSKDQEWQIREKIHPKIRSDKSERKSIQRSGVTNQWENTSKEMTNQRDCHLYTF